MNVQRTEEDIIVLQCIENAYAVKIISQVQKLVNPDITPDQLLDYLKSNFSEDKLKICFGDALKIDELLFESSGNLWREAYGNPNIGDSVKIFGTESTVKSGGIFTFSVHDLSICDDLSICSDDLSICSDDTMPLYLYTH